MCPSATSLAKLFETMVGLSMADFRFLKIWTCEDHRNQGEHRNASLNRVSKRMMDQDAHEEHLQARQRVLV